MAVGEPDDDHRRGDEGAPPDVAQQQADDDGDGGRHRHGPQDGLEGLPEGDLGQVLGEQEQDGVRREQQGVERERLASGTTRGRAGDVGLGPAGGWSGVEGPGPRVDARPRHRRRQSSQGDDAPSSPSLSRAVPGTGASVGQDVSVARGVSSPG